MTDWAWKYAEFGSAVTLTIGVTAYTALPSGEPLKAVDHTSGLAVLDGVQTVDPQAEIQAADLAALGLTAAQLVDATLALNGATWRITSAHPLPTTAGEADGEYLLLLQGS